MNLNEQIEAAWKDESPKVRESLQCSRASQVWGAAEIGFTAGYRAALQSLYVEVKPGEVLAGVDYWVLRDGEWRDAWWFSDRLALDEAKNCERILKLNLPSPSRQVHHESRNGKSTRPAPKRS